MTRATLYRLLKADYAAALLEEDSAWYRRMCWHGKIWGVSIHAPRVRGDTTRRCAGATSQVSIHAPRVRGDTLSV
jgi:hypothetical protein